MLNLHKKDLKILQELDVDARQPISSIAKKIGLSKELTNYRIKQLEKKGIIVGYYSLYNVSSLGYTLYKIFLKLQNFDKTVENEFIKYLTHISQVGLIATSSGIYDMEIGVVCKSLVEFHKILEEITKQYGVYIRSKDITTIVEMWQFNRKYLNPSNSVLKEYHYFLREQSETCDNTDMRIVNCLAHNGRKNNTELEKELGISRKVIGNRIKRMIEKNIILGFRPIINRDKLNLTYFRILIKLQSMDNEVVSKLFYYLKLNPNVVWVNKTIGSWELEIEVEIENGKKCHDLLTEMKYSFNEIIADANIIEIFKDYKYEFVMG